MSFDNDVIAELLKEYQTPEEILGRNGLIQQFTKAVIQRALSAEMDHLPHQRAARRSRRPGSA